MAHVIIEKSQVIAVFGLHVYLHAGTEYGFQRKQVVGFHVAKGELIIRKLHAYLVEVLAEQLHGRFRYQTTGIDYGLFVGIFQKHHFRESEQHLTYLAFFQHFFGFVHAIDAVFPYLLFRLGVAFELQPKTSFVNVQLVADFGGKCLADALTIYQCNEF